MVNPVNKDNLEWINRIVKTVLSLKFQFDDLNINVSVNFNENIFVSISDIDNPKNKTVAFLKRQGAETDFFQNIVEGIYTVYYYRDVIEPNVLIKIQTDFFQRVLDLNKKYEGLLIQPKLINDKFTVNVFRKQNMSKKLVLQLGFPDLSDIEGCMMFINIKIKKEVLI
jgi:hypothetical protein